MKRNRVVFFITDQFDNCWGIAPTKVQARRQINWFLPKGVNYAITPHVIPADPELIKVIHA